VPARRGADRLGRATDALAHAPLQGGREDHRRRGRRHAGPAGRAARRADQAEVLPGALGRSQPAHPAGDRRGAPLTELREQVAAAGRMWGGADYDRVARQVAPIHDELAARLEPSPSRRWLDIGTGTGEVALRAAQAGAEVTAVDISESLLD